MATIDAFLPDILMDVPGCPESVAVNALRHAIEDFCKNSLYWTVDHTPIDIVAGTHTYPLVPPVTDTIINDITYIAHDTQPLDPASTDQLDLYWPKYRQKYPYLNSVSSDPWRSVTADIASLYHRPTPRTVRIVGIPTTSLTGGLTLRVALRPAPTMIETADLLDDTLYEDFREEIAFGAKYRLLIIPNKPWTDVKTAVIHRELFEAGISKARELKSRDYARDNNPVLRVTGYYS